MEEHEEFARSYTLARQIQIEDLMDEILEIADDSATTGSIEKDLTVRSTAYSTLTVFDDQSCG